MVETYRDMFGEDPEVSVIHAGLEGGILMGKNPDFDIVTFGPEMLNVHTPGERLNIESTRKNWEYLKEVLARLK
jgi:dipeptidase D